MSLTRYSPYARVHLVNIFRASIVGARSAAGDDRRGAAAAVESAVNERIDHRVGHTEKEDPHDVTVVEVGHIDEGVNDEHHLIRCPADDERNDNQCRHTEGFHLGLAEQSTSHFGATVAEHLDVVSGCILKIMPIVSDED